MDHSIDTAALKQDHPVADVIARYGTDLRPSGRALVGRCPFHLDRGRPNLYVYPGSASWYCFRCAVGGDVIRFVERLEGINFREAVTRILGVSVARGRPTRLALIRQRQRHARPTIWGPDERACLAAAVELYHGRLLSDPAALTYVTGRGIDLTTIERCRIGYATGDELAAYLRWRRLPLGAAGRVGLLGHDGREFLTGRVVVSEIRAGQPIWLVGRTIDPATPEPKYLGLPGRKPLLGWETAGLASAVVLTEGVFDWLILRCWHFPALALVGTHASPATLRALGRFERIFLVLDGDDAGRTAATNLQRTLGERAVVVALPGVKDVAELALRPDGRARFERAIEEAERSGTAVA